MDSGFTIKLITKTHTHLWEDARFFLEQAVICRNDTDTWNVGTYARGSILCSVSAFESSCAFFFGKKNFSNKIGIIRGVKKQLKCQYRIDFQADDDPLWKQVGIAIDYRNTFTHGKCDQNGLFIDYPLAAETAITLLAALQHLFALTHKTEEKWIAEYICQFKELINKNPLC